MNEEELRLELYEHPNRQIPPRDALAAVGCARHYLS
jgi:hypothetical protein